MIDVVCVHQNIYGGRVRLQSIVTLLAEFDHYDGKFLYGCIVGILPDVFS
jgi:hypothetical protein